MAEHSRHALVGEYRYEDMVLCRMHPASTVDRVGTFQYQPGDILLASYPKTGTTWSQELVWLVCNQGDTETAGRIPLRERFPHMELSRGAQGPHAMDSIYKLTGTRFMKSHLPVRFFPTVLADNSQKVVVVVRNPKDTLVSLYHFYRMHTSLGCFKGSWDEFFELHKERHMYYGDFFDWYLSWWQYRDRDNVLFLKYEDMQSDLKKVIREVARFTDQQLSDETIDRIVRHLGFDQMSKNAMTNYADSPVLKHEISPFMRKGAVGDWKNYFNEEQSKYVDRQYKETLERAGLILSFD